MANPQLENGYVKIATEIMEAFARYRIPGEARQVLDFILRKTYGWNKKEDEISLAQFIVGTGLKKPTVCRSIHKLIHLNLIIKKDNGKKVIYRFNKDFSTWKILSKKITQEVVHKKQSKPLSKKIMTVIKNDNGIIENIGKIINRRYQK